MLALLLSPKRYRFTAPHLLLHNFFRAIVPFYTSRLSLFAVGDRFITTSSLPSNVFNLIHLMMESNRYADSMQQIKCFNRTNFAPFSVTISVTRSQTLLSKNDSPRLHPPTLRISFGSRNLHKLLLILYH